MLPQFIFGPSSRLPQEYDLGTIRQLFSIEIDSFSWFLSLQKAWTNEQRQAPPLLFRQDKQQAYFD
jgi:hypothetical protein